MKNFSESRSFRILRWIGFLPLSFAGAFIVDYVNDFIFTSTIMGTVPLIISILIRLITGYAFVAIGVYVVPDYRKIISIILSSLVVMVCIVSMCATFSSMSGQGLISTITNMISLMVGAVGMTVCYCTGLIENK